MIRALYREIENNHPNISQQLTVTGILDSNYYGGLIINIPDQGYYDALRIMYFTPRGCYALSLMFNNTFVNIGAIGYRESVYRYFVQDVVQEYHRLCAYTNNEITDAITEYNMIRYNLNH